MTRQQTTSHRRIRRQLWRLVGLGVALAALAGVVVLRVQPQRTAHQQTATTTSAGQAAASTGATSATPVSGRLTATTVYIAHTMEQAQTLRSWLAAGRFAVPEGAPEQAAVILAPSAAEAAFARDAVRNGLQDAGVAAVVVDAATITGP
jgi:hypothetical protein